jgi:hypothetical protein
VRERAVSVRQVRLSQRRCVKCGDRLPAKHRFKTCRACLSVARAYAKEQREVKAARRKAELADQAAAYRLTESFAAAAEKKAERLRAQQLERVRQGLPPARSSQAKPPPIRTER